ncbi:MAG: hypothetical protein F6J87_23920 [Spirulina sp. SIO3F2]|nr:hypothetical protein [Spirulina sp. SIO3F2]
MQSWFSHLFSLTTLWVLGSPFPVWANAEYIGLNEVPEHLTFQGGWVIRDSPYIVDIVVDAECRSRPCAPGQAQMLWLEETLELDEHGVAHFEVVDVIELQDGYEVGFAKQLFRYCAVEGELDLDVFAIAQFEPEQEVLTTIHQAWRVNRDAGAFEIIQTTKVSCFNPLPGGH